MTNAGFAFDDLAKAAANGMTRRRAFVRAAKVLGGIIFGTLGLRSSFLQGADTPANPEGPRFTETLKDKTFKCTSTKGAMRVEEDYDVCLHRVLCVSTQPGVARRLFMIPCKAVNGKCPNFQVCDDPVQQKDKPIIHEKARLAEIGPDDRRPTDKYGRTCRYDTVTPMAVFLNSEKRVLAFCATPITCTGGDADAPDRAFAVCEPTDDVKEEKATRPTLICPRVNYCINTPIKSSKAEVIDGDN